MTTANEARGDEVHDVGETVAVGDLFECEALVIPGEEEVEERDDGAIELGARLMLTVVGLKAFQTMDLQMLVAMKRRARFERDLRGVR
jgi:hypothetical protein